MTIASILASKSKRLIKVEAETSIGDVAQVLHTNNIGAALVMRGDELLGVLSDRGITRALALHETGVRRMPAESAMRPRQYVTTPSATIEDAMRVMTATRVRYLPVYDAETLVGLVSIGDVVKALLDRQNATVESLTAYIGQG